MLRNGKALALTLVTLVIAGCAKSDYVTSRNQNSRWFGGNRPSVSQAPLAVPPKILPETHFAAAQLFEAQGLLGNAITQYRKAVAVNHGYYEGYHRLGVVLGTIGRHSEAITVLKKARELRPEDPVLRNNLGFQLMLKGRLQESEREFRRAIELDPRFARAYVNLGMLLTRQDRFDEALTSFLAVLPEPDAYYNLGITFRGHRKHEQAVNAFKRALAIDPDFTAAAVQLEQMAGQTARTEASAAFAKEMKLVAITEHRSTRSAIAELAVNTDDAQTAHSEVAAEPAVTPPQYAKAANAEKTAALQAIEQMFLDRENAVIPEDALDSQGVAVEHAQYDDGVSELSGRMAADAIVESQTVIEDVSWSDGAGADEPRRLMKATVVDESEPQFSPFDYQEWFDWDYTPCPDEYFEQDDFIEDGALDWLLREPVQEPDLSEIDKSMSSLIGAGSVIGGEIEIGDNVELPFPPPLAIKWTNPNNGPWVDEPIVGDLGYGDVVDKAFSRKPGDAIRQRGGFAIADVNQQSDMPFRLDKHRPSPIRDERSRVVASAKIVDERPNVERVARPVPDDVVRNHRISQASGKTRRPIFSSKVLKVFVPLGPIDHASQMKRLEVNLDAVRNEIDCWDEVVRERHEARIYQQTLHKIRMNSSAAARRGFVRVCELEPELTIPVPPGAIDYFAANAFEKAQPVYAMSSIVILDAPSKGITRTNRPVMAGKIFVERAPKRIDRTIANHADINDDVVEHFPAKWDSSIENVKDLASIVQNEVNCRHLAEEAAVPNDQVIVRKSNRLQK